MEQTNATINPPGNTHSNIGEHGGAGREGGCSGSRKRRRRTRAMATRTMISRGMLRDLSSLFFLGEESRGTLASSSPISRRGHGSSGSGGESRRGKYEYRAVGDAGTEEQKRTLCEREERHANLHLLFFGNGDRRVFSPFPFSLTWLD